jgi:hypothetical protein
VAATGVKVAILEPSLSETASVGLPETDDTKIPSRLPELVVIVVVDVMGVAFSASETGLGILGLLGGFGLGHVGFVLLAA